MKKKCLAFLLALMMCLSLLPTAALAANSDFVIESGVLMEYRGPGGNVTIPNGVTSIRQFAFANCSGLTSVSIPDSVTEIGRDAFANCTSLTSLTIPKSVTRIGSFAFAGCSKLTSATILSGVTSIEQNVFQDCTSLTSVSLPSSVTSIEQYAFYRCTGLTGITIPNGVTGIEQAAFKGCSSLTKVDLPASLTRIGFQAFADCSSLTDVAIPGNVTSIQQNVFGGCGALRSVTIPLGVTSIPQEVFYNCIALKDVYYAGTREQWKEISIGDSNNPLKNATIHYNSARAKFTDLKPNGFYVDAVEWAVANGVTTGKTATTFAPSETCTHGQILTFLWRAAGEPESSAQPPIDLKGNEFYYKAVKWAAEKGMIGANFNPNAPCNRAYAVQYIWQVFDKPDPSKASSFTDVPAHWSSAPAVAWAVEKGVTTGTSATAFSPAKICDRGTIVTFLYRAYK